MNGKSSSRDRPACDVLVVGAGPAGLAAAWRIRQRSQLRVFLIDAGDDIYHRLARRQSRSADQDHLVSGVGGAGLFSDGKLCLSLDVGGDLPAQVSTRQKRVLLSQVKALMQGALCSKTQHPVHGNFEPSMTSLGDLQHLDYPVLHIGTDRAGEQIRHLCNELRRAGVTLMPRCRLLDIERNRLNFRAAVEKDGELTSIQSRFVVLALGKVGAAVQAELCRGMQINIAPQPMDIGVRLETDANSVSDVFRRGGDQKFKMFFSDKSRIKTHCVAAGGDILRLSYNGLPLAGGHSFSDAGGGRTSFSLLWNGIRSNTHSYDEAARIMRRVADVSGGKLLVQTLHDYRRGIASSVADVARCRMSLQDWTAGDLRSVLPTEYFHRLDAFLDELSIISPGVASETSVLCAPAIEWWMSRVHTDANMRTAVPGLYVAGDGAGWSQGIVQAAATGLLAANGVVADARSVQRKTTHAFVPEEEPRRLISGRRPRSA